MAGMASCEESLHPTEARRAKTSLAASGSMDEGGEAVQPKKKSRKVAFRSEVEEHHYSESFENEDEFPLVRSQAFRLRETNKQDSSSKPSSQPVRALSKSGGDVGKTPGGFQSIVPDKRERAQRSMLDRLRAAAKEVHLPSFRAWCTSRKVCPE
eukprot:TRINITY_DN41846_c0_g1_i1.p1 TRINITY_DN41846_c0_g1~~TRINITY_DN41846_c0_g1_i1.p1  ORF type:complete len:154 (-),score=30.25 TRINITY_DN41846_c0_g1_i1:174-635(-)